MNRISLISAALLAAFSFNPSHAAPVCAGSSLDDGTPVLSCGEAGSSPLVDNRDTLQVRVEAGAGVTSSSRNTTPLDLGGAAQVVTNDGTIANADSRNNAYAITSRGNDLSIINRGEISSGDRAIEVLGGRGGLKVENHGEISARRQAVRSLEGFENAEVINHGLIESQEGRALQLRGDGARVINRGNLVAGEEVVEARGNFYMENYGNVVLRDGVVDGDGVQFASGTLHNSGLISGSDDGVDLDEGRVHNQADGRIVSTGDDATRDAGGIDVDPDFDNGVDPIRPAGDLTIINEGLIEGPRAIVTDLASTASIDIINSGTLYGRSGIAVDLAPGQGDSTLTIKGGSDIRGDVLFGAGNDSIFIDNLVSGKLGTGVFDGGRGRNSVYFLSYTLTDLLDFLFDGDVVELSFASLAGKVSGSFRGFDSWGFGDGSQYDTLALASHFDNANTVPTPATLPLLLSALGGLWLACRRRRH